MDDVTGYVSGQVGAEWQAEPSLRPTRKWWAARVIAVAALLTMWATTGSWDLEETVAAIGIGSEGLLSWLTPNQPTPGGVPER